VFMKAFIPAGGQGARISEESYLQPKPMIEIGGKPILDSSHVVGVRMNLKNEA
jgi:NDP-sugar pyrophosphorylase family protein